MTKSKSGRKMIKKVRIFAGLSGGALAALEDACRRQTAKKGALIVKEGTPGRHWFLIGQGRVEVIKVGRSGETRLVELGAGDFFGEMSIIECRKRSASIRALEPIILYRLERGDLLRVFQKWPGQYAILIYNIARDLCRRLREMDEVFAGRAF